MRLPWKYAVRAYPFSRGRGRLVNMARRSLSGIVVDRDRFGNRLLLDLDNHIDCMIFLEGAYELESLTQLAEHGARIGCDHFIDVGANLGVYTLFFSRQPNMQRLWAFEPDPRNRAQLTANLWLNRLGERVEILEYALSNDEGPATFYVNTLVRAPGQLSYNTGSSSLLKADSPIHRPINVQKRRLDNVIQVTGRKILIKIDVEGAEPMVLEGARQVLLDNQCLVMVEIWDHPAGALDKTSGFMSGLGYQRIAANVGESNYLFANSAAAA